MYDVKLQFLGERQGSALDPLKPFLKEGFKNPKNFKKIIYPFFESFRKSRNPFSKGFLVGCRGETPALQTQI